MNKFKEAAFSETAQLVSKRRQDVTCYTERKERLTEENEKNSSTACLRLSSSLAEILKLKLHIVLTS